MASLKSRAGTRSISSNRLKWSLAELLSNDAVDLLSDEVGVAVMTGVRLHELDDVPPRRTTGAGPSVVQPGASR
ncbi:MAG TPA: hypothetical protein VG815_11910 [Chloroflexota bacterium]|nr:hypothetical protein [Chloroflexota bacterium]